MLGHSYTRLPQRKSTHTDNSARNSKPLFQSHRFATGWLYT
jgi:hypothetical protein